MELVTGSEHVVHWTTFFKYIQKLGIKLEKELRFGIDSTKMMFSWQK
jgi:hypothetical protein